MKHKEKTKKKTLRINERTEERSNTELRCNTSNVFHLTNHIQNIRRFVCCSYILLRFGCIDSMSCWIAKRNETKQFHLSEIQRFQKLNNHNKWHTTKHKVIHKESICQRKQDEKMANENNQQRNKPSFRLFTFSSRDYCTLDVQANDDGQATKQIREHYLCVRARMNSHRKKLEQAS